MKTNIRLLIYRVLVAVSMLCAATAVGLTVLFIVHAAEFCR